LVSRAAVGVDAAGRRAAQKVGMMPMPLVARLALPPVLVAATMLAVMPGGGGASPRSTGAGSGSGDLDPSFGRAGIATRDVFGHDDSADAVTITRSGEIVVAGTAAHDSLDAINPNTDFFVVRYRDDGSLDTSFGSGGVVTVDLAGQDDWLTDVVEQPDGKLLLVGTTEASGPFVESAGIVRLLPDGTRDRSFGRNGVLVIPNRAFVSPDCVFPEAATVMKDGRIVVVGTGGCGGEDGGFLNVFAFRLRPDGTLDRSFADHGTWSASEAATDLTARAACEGTGVAVRRDGGILIGGVTGDEEFCFGTGMLLMRLRSDGSTDTRFADHGRLRVRFRGGGTTGAIALGLDARGRTVLAGYAGHRFALVRVLPNGRLDRSFSGDGRVTRRASARAHDYATGVAVTRGGQITISGPDYLGGGHARFVLLRFRPNGSPDRSFSGDGIAVVSFGSRHELANDLALDHQGRTVAVGSASLPATGNDLAVTRVR
jgi:uncharacterized delta-60 repeat protein